MVVVRVYVIVMNGKYVKCHMICVANAIHHHKSLDYNKITKGKRIYKFIVYLCPHCKRKIKNPENHQKFSNSCDEFIEEYLDTCGP